MPLPGSVRAQRAGKDWLMSAPFPCASGGLSAGKEGAAKKRKRKGASDDDEEEDDDIGAKTRRHVARKRAS